MTGRRIAVQGTVQGVGFRPWVYQLARQLHVAGTVKNGPEGVTIDAFAPPAVLDELLVRLERELPPAARIDSLEWQPLEAPPPVSFTIIGSDSQGAARASIPADLAMCDACRAEIHDPHARRFHYPFTNCTHCGPRFSIATAIPYDRPRTTMAGFPLCDDCRREYENPDDRRFHAQPIACPKCGPKLTWLDAQGTALDVGDPLAHAAKLLAGKAIVAVRGLGGFHLACNALNEGAIRSLRQRKHRDEKPLAVMVADLEMARRYAELTAEETALLSSPARPIVLARMKHGLAPSIAPGFTQVGLFLPYTPLHELLLVLARKPLVMTSGNRSEEPMAVDNDEAVRRLAGIADGFLVHDRPIATRTDDSVARIVEGAPMLLRRARGFVPESLASPLPFAEPVLAVGGQLKNTFCIGKGARLTPGPHVGDLGELSTFESFTAMAARLERFLEVSPRVLAHDLHPDYDTTRWARERGGHLVGVQHHHAHVAAVMAEHGLKGPVLGVAFDGTGLGDDGAAWGGEFLRCTYAGFERVATLRPIALAGGERAIRDAWRLALAVLDDAFDGAPPLGRLALFNTVSERDVKNVRQLLPSALPAHGAGRAFDAAAALAFGRPRANFEAQLAMTLEQAATAGAAPFPFTIDRSETPWEVDLRPMWRAFVEELLAGREVASRFHATLGAATAAVVTALDEQERLPVVLSGGCFANALLTHDVLRHLGGFDVRLPRKVPAGDGGLALGQAVVAAARLEGAS
ncbi:MAG: carbamoyltransferase HypF [Myxococcota bacterium]